MTPLDLIDEASRPVPADEAVKPGRKRDHTRDPEILDAALEVLSEVGFDGMTVDMVATRAKAGKATLYRRWPSKAELVIDAVACMKKSPFDENSLPDTGSLRGDLVALIKSPSVADGQRKLQIMAGLVSMLSRNPELAEAVREAIIEPRAAVNRALLRRAIDRGEARADCDVELLSMVSASMTAHRVLVERKPITRDYIIRIIDGIILPAAGVAPSA
jgi:AcrR family transcriptional regulator